MEKIGFVGTGAMGSALLSRLKLANIVATAFDISSAALDAASAEGAETAPSAKAVAQSCTLIDVVVRTDQEVLECMLGNDGVLEGAAPGSLVLLHSTIRPATTKKVAELAADKRVNVIDACPKRCAPGRFNFSSWRAKSVLRARQAPSIEDGQRRRAHGSPWLRQREQAFQKHGYRLRGADRL